jgi:hypothetical protein
MVNDRPRHNMSMSPEKPLELASSDTHNNGSHVDDPIANDMKSLST